MSQKLIQELQLRSDFDDTVSLAGDDGTQTQRVTGAQMRSFMEPLSTNLSQYLRNVGMNVVSESNALTISMRQSNGTSALVSGNVVNRTEIAFRSTTLTSAGRTIVQFDSATSVVLPSGATLGYPNNAPVWVFVYAFFDGTNKGLGVSQSILDESRLHNFAVLNSSSNLGIPYATDSRSNCAVRLIGGIRYDSLSTAGSWVAPTLVTTRDFVLDSQLVLPPGMLMSWSTQIAPAGWLHCNGAQISRSDFANLFAAIGTRYGTGNGSTTFHLPDFRGRFLRGWANGDGRDPDRGDRIAMNTGGVTGDNVGSIQGWATKRIEGTVESFRQTTASGSIHTFTTNAFNSSFITSTSLAQLATTTSGNGRSQLVFNSDNVTPSTNRQASNNETRPINATVMYVIKY